MLSILGVIVSEYDGQNGMSKPRLPSLMPSQPYDD
ncbi:unnamed protein product, partial [marine sediment metagenome]